MFMIRETMHCKPGKVRELVDRFKALSKLIAEMGYTPFRLYTDVSGERFWTVVAETDADSVEAFIGMEQKVMANEKAKQIMAGYHDLVLRGFRQIYKAER
jgi:heme-degrading monooxygenase HmoA